MEQAKRNGRKVLPALFDGEVAAISTETAKLHLSEFNKFLENPKKFGIDASTEQVPMLIKTGRVQFVQVEGED